VAGKHAYEIWGESLREVGILLLVFGPLDTVFKGGQGSLKDWLIAGAVALVGLILILIGVRMESET
jgi:hypothetical protein